MAADDCTVALCVPVSVARQRRLDLIGELQLRGSQFSARRYRASAEHNNGHPVPPPSSRSTSIVARMGSTKRQLTQKDTQTLLSLRWLWWLWCGSDVMTMTVDTATRACTLLG